jgi:predicted DNA-binding transcriptional regulator YafY
MSITSAPGASRLEETKRISRVLQIIALISSRPRRWTRGALAGRFEVSERMIDKDLQLIRHGLSYELGHSSQGYLFSRETAVQPVHLAMAEALSLVLAAQQSLMTGSADRPTLSSALARLEDALPAAVGRHARMAANERRAFEAPARDRSRVLLLLEEAVVERKKVRIRYVSASRQNAETDRAVAPYSLVPHQRSWFLVGQDSYRQAVIMFNVDRIKRCELTSEPYQMPPDFDLASYLGSNWGVMRGQAKEPVDVALVFDPQARVWAEEMSWHPSQSGESLPDGSLQLTFHCGVTDELLRWVLWFGSSVEVEAPSSLRAAVRREAEKMVETPRGKGRSSHAGKPTIER